MKEQGTSDDNLRWRDKYLDYVEAEEKRSALLRRGLVCVSLAVDNADKQLEKQLNALRELLRSNSATESLAGLIDNLEEAVRKLDDRRRSGQGGLRDTWQAMARTLEPLLQTREQRKQLKQFLRDIDNPDLQQQTSALLARYLALQQGVLANLLQTQPVSEPGLLERLFGRHRAVLPVVLPLASPSDTGETAEDDDAPPAAMTVPATAIATATTVTTATNATENPPTVEESVEAPVAIAEVTTPAAALPESPDVAIVESANPDIAMTDVARPDAAVADVAVQEVAVSEVAVPDAVMTGSDHLAEAVLPADAVSAETADSESASFEIVRASNSIDTYEGEAVRERVANILLNLLDQLQGSTNDAALDAELRTRWQQNVQWPELPELLSETLNHFAGHSISKQKEYEAFLLSLNSRLGEIHRVLDLQQGQYAQAEKSGERFDSSLRQHLAGISDSVAGAADIGEVKQAIQLHLESISESMESYRREEHGRAEQLAGQVAELTHKLAGMERESQQLRADIQREHQRALQDVLTGLPNRQAYQERMALESQRLQRYGNPLCIGVCDVDFFKRINDNYGHLAGDKVLRLVSRALQKSLRATDFIGRYGGEEFVVVMPETTIEAASGVMEKLRKAVESCPFHFSGSPVVITLSCGVTRMLAHETATAAFERADMALLQAKQTGRNKVIAA